MCTVYTVHTFVVFESFLRVNFKTTFVICEFCDESQTVTVTVMTSNHDLSLEESVEDSGGMNMKLYDSFQ